MIRTYLIPLLAVLGVVFAAYTVIAGSKPPTAQPPVVEPPRSPFPAFVAGSGLVEASTQNIAIGAPVGAVVKRVGVVVGDRVKAGDMLFELDERDLRAELGSREAAVSVAHSQLKRLQAGTRDELLPPARARVAEAEATLEDAQSQLTKWEQVQDKRAVSEDDITRRRFAVRIAATRVDQARADLALLEAGTWSPDIAVAQSQVAQAEAQATATRIEIDRRVVRAPVDGRVLQVNTRIGEFAQAGALSTPLMLMGVVEPLHLRVDIDEHDSWRVTEGAKAFAYARGNKDITTPLSFVRFEPYIVPKRSLTGESTERVDTRVLQVIYKFERGSLPIFVGQQMDIYIEAAPIDSKATPAEATKPKN